MRSKEVHISVRERQASFLPVYLLIVLSAALPGCWLTDSTQDGNQIIIVGQWVPKGVSLNVNNGGHQDASSPRTVLNSGIPYITWIEKNSVGIDQVYVKHWNGLTWVLDPEATVDGLNVDPTKSATGDLDIGADGTFVYVAWTESGSGAHVKRLNPATGAWAERPDPSAGGPLSQAVNSPRLSSSRGIAFVGGVLYVILAESGVVRVKRYNASLTQWEIVQPDLNSIGGTSPALVAKGSTLFAAWIEGDALMVSRQSGSSSWIASQVNLPDGNVETATDPSLIVSRGVLYIGWTGGDAKTHVASWNGSSWTDVTFGPDPSNSFRNSSGLRLADWTGALVTAFLTPDGRIRTSLLVSTGQWLELGNGLNEDLNQTASSAAIVGSSIDNPWVAWLEPDANGVQLFVDHWE